METDIVGRKACFFCKPYRSLCQNFLCRPYGRCKPNSPLQNLAAVPKRSLLSYQPLCIHLSHLVSQKWMNFQQHLEVLVF
jgi:hypothetical protein